MEGVDEINDSGVDEINDFRVDKVKRKHASLIHSVSSLRAVLLKHSFRERLGNQRKSTLCSLNNVTINFDPIGAISEIWLCASFDPIGAISEIWLCANFDTFGAILDTWRRARAWELRALACQSPSARSQMPHANATCGGEEEGRHPRQKQTSANQRTGSKHQPSQQIHEYMHAHAHAHAHTHTHTHAHTHTHIHTPGRGRGARGFVAP